MTCDSAGGELAAPLTVSQAEGGIADSNFLNSRFRLLNGRLLCRFLLRSCAWQQKLMKMIRDLCKTLDWFHL